MRYGLGVSQPPPPPKKRARRLGQADKHIARVDKGILKRGGEGLHTSSKLSQIFSKPELNLGVSCEIVVRPNMSALEQTGLCCY